MSAAMTEDEWYEHVDAVWWRLVRTLEPLPVNVIPDYVRCNFDLAAQSYVTWVHGECPEPEPTPTPAPRLSGPEAETEEQD